jgi:DnaJ-domain-containing protein 1
MPRERTNTARLSFEEARPQVRPCDVPGCVADGCFRAPRSRDRLNEYWWFCLDHVREYNSRWDYYAGMSERDIEQELRRDMTWQRPTWPLGSWYARERHLRDRVMRGFAFGDDEAAEAAAHAAARPRARTPEDDARAVLDVTASADFNEIKARYRELVKRHHPDANGGDKDAEERLKQINQAYTTLKTCYGA